MQVIFGLIAASLLGVDSPRAADAPDITFDVKILDMAGLEWRSTFYPELQPVARRGEASVWTAPSGTVAKLAAKADKVVSAPRVTCFSQVRATVFQTKAIAMVADFDRYADGPVNHASTLVFRPKVENSTEGYSVNVSGRKLDQGILTQVTIEDKQIVAVHVVTLIEAIESGRNASAKLKAKLQIPETVQARVSGEWLVPNDGVLVVSLGVHTVADSNGKAVVRERLALLEARAIEPTAAGASVQTMKVSFPYPLTNISHPKISMPLAIIPSRSMPQGLSAYGVPVPLPPLPDESATPPTALPGSSEPCATPQVKGVPVGDPIPLPSRTPLRDPSSRQAGYSTEPGCCELGDDCPAIDGLAAAVSAPEMPRAFTFRLPLKSGLQLEIHAGARQVPSDNAPAPPTYPAPE